MTDPRSGGRARSSHLIALVPDPERARTESPEEIERVRKAITKAADGGYARRVAALREREDRDVRKHRLGTLVFGGFALLGWGLFGVDVVAGVDLLPDVPADLLASITAVPTGAAGAFGLIFRRATRTHRATSRVLDTSIPVFAEATGGGRHLSDLVGAHNRLRAAKVRIPGPVEDEYVDTLLAATRIAELDEALHRIPGRVSEHAREWSDQMGELARGKEALRNRAERLAAVLVDTEKSGRAEVDVTALALPSAEDRIAAELARTAEIVSRVSVDVKLEELRNGGTPELS